MYWMENQMENEIELFIEKKLHGKGPKLDMGSNIYIHMYINNYEQIYI